jgi:hypothetical protein
VIKSADQIKYEAHVTLVLAKRESVEVKSAILAMHCDLPYEQQDIKYIRNLRSRIAKTRNELRNMKDD